MVPLFHERVMVAATETAFEMIEALNEGNDSRKIIGVYDAPIKGSSEDETVSQLALSLAEQIKQANNSLDSIIVRVKVPKSSGEDDETEEQTREITAEAEEGMRSVLLNVYAC